MIFIPTAPSPNNSPHNDLHPHPIISPLSLTVGYKQVKTIELPQQRSSSVATQQTTVSSVPSQPSTAGVSDPAGPWAGDTAPGGSWAPGRGVRAQGEQQLMVVIKDQVGDIPVRGDEALDESR